MPNQPILKSLKLAILGLIMAAVAGCGWETKWKGKTGIIADMPGGSVLVDGGKDINGQATIHINDTFYENTKCRIIAIDNWGQVHIGEQSSKLVTERKYRTTEAVFPNLTMKDIKEFRFQIRPHKQK